jgi:hypothetical protein
VLTGERDVVTGYVTNGAPKWTAATSCSASSSTRCRSG